MEKKAKWIWFCDTPKPDEYGEFRVCFPKPEKTCTLQISVDSEYAVYCNGELAAFGQYADYPDHKVYDTVLLDAYLRDGENELQILAWHCGVDSLTHIKMPAGLRFALMDGDKLLRWSDETTLSRAEPHYIPHECQWITIQLGLTFSYRAAPEETPFHPSVLAAGLAEELYPRPVKKLQLLERMPMRVVRSGGFRLAGGENAAQRMQRAALTADEIRTLELQRGDGEDGVYVILDMGEETAGFLDLDIKTPEACTIEIGWGEHLDDGRCRTAVRNFSCIYQTVPGENRYLNPFRRLGCRYLQLFIYGPGASVRYAGIRPTVYPVNVLPFSTGNLLRDRIYEVCVQTLRHCMHEHYEDCPWREQALYTMDSRNQMLCGYYAFGQTEFARASLDLISHGVLDHGLLDLCYPAGWGYPIPSFNLVYFTQMKEYLYYSGDVAFLEEKYPMLAKLMETFLRKPKENGLIENFYGPGDFWNFYEWAPTMQGRFHETERAIEAPLNAFLSLALQDLAEIADRLDRPADADRYRKEAAQINEALRKVFFDQEKLLFHSFLDRDWERYSVLTNSLCLLCGAADGLDKGIIRKILLANGSADSGLDVVPNTLSMNIFRFDALLKDGGDVREAILRELDETYFSMLCRGATTFWETAHLEEDFEEGAGSMCHGWSALPIYYYHTLEVGQKKVV